MKDMTLSEKATYSTVLIKCEYFDGSFGSGTGFVFDFCIDSKGEQCVPTIITNNHIMNNCKKCTFEFCKSDDNNNPIDKEVIPLVCNNPTCIKHSDPNIDLCCIPIASISEELQKNNIKIFHIPLDVSIIPSQTQLEELSAMEEIVMIGYPIGLSDTYNHKPILRRGTTATHMKNDYQGKKEFLIDMACFPGSSGSPIFIINQGSYTVGNTVRIASRIYLCGILYGGPQYQASGAIAFANLPNSPIPIVNIPTNLGIAIKSSELLFFEEYFKELTGGTKQCLM